MPAKLDLTGQKYGKLTVIKESAEKKNGRVTWECLCDCGNPEIVLVTTKNLRNGITKSCGCLKHKDLVGQKFGKLTVIEATSERRHGSVVWKCLCDCGNPNPVYATTEGLRVGDNTTCGCSNKARDKFAKENRINLIGKRYGRLLVLKDTDQRTPHGNVMWECLCDCGNKILVSTNHLQSGNTKSCGCLEGQSVGELKIFQLLKENNIRFKTQYSFPDLPKKRYDFAILDENDSPIQLIEFDGEQHFLETNFFPMSLEEQKARDEMKTQFAKEKNIPLIRIPYWKRENLIFEDLQVIKKESK